jgi:hypothetical protein
MAEQIKQPTTNEILGVRGRSVKPRRVPHGYQVEQWERNEQALEQAQAIHPTLDRDSFMAGWNAAFSAIYGG